MTKFAATLIILIFAGISIFGFAVMSHGTHVLCPAEQIQGRECSAGMDPLAVLIFHVGALKAFSSGIPAASILTLLVFAVAFLILVAILTSASVKFLARPFYLAKTNFLCVLTAKQFIHWLQLRENSPNPF